MSRETKSFDAIVIGCGQSGPPLAVALAKAGRRVLIAERKYFGGTCVNNGCIPTKTLLANARAAHVARHAGDFGVSTGPISVDMKQVKARKDAMSAKSREGVEKMLRTTKNVTVIEGHARFVDNHTVDIDGKKFTAPQIFLDVGARATIPDIDGIDAVPYFTNATIMHVDFLPEHLLIVGGSYIGLEFAQMYRRFGSRVTVLQRGPRLITREDPEVSDAMSELMASEDIAVHVDVKKMRVEKTRDGIRLRATSRRKPVDVEASHLLLATGRSPNTDDLGLENTTIERDEHGFIRVNDTLQTSARGVWAMGDCNGRGAFTHTSYNDYEIVAANLLTKERRRVSDRIVTYAIFTDPPLARVGMTATDIRAAKKKALVGYRLMSRVNRANERGEPRGFIQIFVDAKSKHILGACMFGIEADESIHAIVDTMYAKKPYTTITHAVHIHPTVSELIPTTLEDLKPLGDA